MGEEEWVEKKGRLRRRWAEEKEKWRRWGRGGGAEEEEGGKQHTRAETRPDSSSSGSGVGRPRKKRTELWARGLCQKRQAK